LRRGRDKCQSDSCLVCGPGHSADAPCSTSHRRRAGVHRARIPSLDVALHAETRNGVVTRSRLFIFEEKLLVPRRQAPGDPARTTGVSPRERSGLARHQHREIPIPGLRPSLRVQPAHMASPGAGRSARPGDRGRHSAEIV
jgi:hypothetical protein